MFPLCSVRIIYHNRGRDQMRKKGGPEFECLWDVWPMQNFCGFQFYFFCRTKREFFFPKFNIRLYDKNSQSDFFFPPSKSEYFFQQHWESEYFFRNSRNSSIITLTNHRNLRQNQLPLYIL
jgi:hypothetical protein